MSKRRKHQACDERKPRRRRAAVREGARRGSKEAKRQGKETSGQREKQAPLLEVRRGSKEWRLRWGKQARLQGARVGKKRKQERKKGREGEEQGRGEDGHPAGKGRAIRGRDEASRQGQRRAKGKRCWRAKRKRGR